MNYQFNYTRLLVNNFNACFLFYRDVMGFKPTYGTESDVYADFDTGAVILALFDRQAMSEALGTTGLPARGNAQDACCLCFSVDSVDEACEQLKGKGISLVTPPTDQVGWGIRAAHFSDPDGNLIEINQPLARP